MKKNLGLKILSLIVAILLSIYVNGRLQNSVISFIVPIEVKNLPEEKIILHPKTLQAKVTLRGPSYLVTKLATNPTALKVNIPKNIRGNTVEVPLATNELELPPTVKVDGIDPAKLTLKLDERVEQVVKLKVPTIGEISKSLELESLTTEPKVVKVSGPQTLLMDLTSLETTPIDLREVKEKSTQDVVVLVPNEFTKLETEKAIVTIDVITKRAERQFPKLPIEIRAKTGGSYLAKPSIATIDVAGPLELIDGLKETDLIPFVRIESDFKGTKEFKLQVETREEVNIISSHPESLKVTRKK